MSWLKVFWHLLIIDMRCLPRHFKIRYYSWKLRQIDKIRVKRGWHFTKSRENQALEKKVMEQFAAVFPGTTIHDFDNFVESFPFFSLRFLKRTVLGLFLK